MASNSGSSRRKQRSIFITVVVVAIIRRMVLKLSYLSPGITIHKKIHRLPIKKHKNEVIGIDIGIDFSKVFVSHARQTLTINSSLLFLFLFGDVAFP